MKTVYQLLCFVVFSLISSGAFAQEGYTVSGIVTNEKGEPLKGATVFVGGSERIMAADDNGRFNFNYVPAGSFQLSVQMIGFAPLTRNVIVKNTSVTIDMKMQVKTINLGQVTVGNKKAWARNFKIFSREFLGGSANGKQCTILNPEVVNFSTKKGLLMADADDFLIIENKRLGYRIRYLIKDFGYNYVDGIVLYHGEFSFEELKGTDEQKQQWAKNRLETYKGSFMHFLRSVYANNTLENGFLARPLYGYGTIRFDSSVVDRYKVIVKNRPVKFDSLVTPIDTTFSAFRFKQLYVIYDPKKAALFATYMSDSKKNMVISNKATLLRLATDVAVIDKKGSYTDYRDFFIQGYWARERVGDQLPVEYKPPLPDIPRGTVLTNPRLNALVKWTDSIPQEKAYLHMDKPYYAPGDTIWFKGYLTSGSRHQLSRLSGSAYVDLINQQNESVKTLQLPVDSGTIAGNLTLTDDIKAGAYRLRAYTQWMRNAGADYFFDHTFTVGNPKTFTEKTDPKSGLLPTDIQFFPESGNLINGITSRVGFKAVGTDGLGVAISGTITDNNNKEIAQINTLRAGMGNFLLKPLPGKTYTANIKFAGNVTKSVALPMALNEGYVLSVYQPNKDSVLVRIHASPGLKQSSINLIVHRSGEIVFASPVNIAGSITSIWLEKKSIPSGIAQFTIFDKNYQPLNERIAFIKNNDHMQLSIKTNKALFKSKEHVQLELNAKEFNESPVAANFSIAVIDESKVPVDESAESTIFSNILLSSDIKGYIERPNYYFTADTDEVNQALDNLMLTQGYRRFEWTLLDSVINTKPKFKAEGLGRTIAGTVTDLQHKPSPNATVMLVSVNARISKVTTTDAYGQFKFANLIFPDSAKFAVQARGIKNSSNLIISLDSVLPVAINKKQNAVEVNIIKANLQKAEQEGISAQLAGMHVLKQVEIKSTVKNANKGNATQEMFSLPDEQSADNILTIPDPENYLTLEMFLQARLAGIRIREDPQGFKVLMDSRYPTAPILTDERIKSGHITQTHEIGIIVNGRHITSHSETDEILEGSIGTEDIAKIEVIRNNLAMVNLLRSGDDYKDGYVIIVTKLPTQRKHYDPNIVNISPKGYNSVRQFYSPRYDRPNNAAKPDLRTTIYWNPYVNTDVNGKATLDFFNSDGPGTYRVVVEGINAAGELGRQIYTYKVE
ncbi:carboxypeptidase regulatory-like domain-containing protein [Mucilaginibacter panaciglaebae]|uniref:Uncharacterized protein n=1 Tax=Mucilaginibacter panaciglaebae TaxID=502331 RepID=A0ABP7X4B1_9SPHI